MFSTRFFSACAAVLAVGVLLVSQSRAAPIVVTTSDFARIGGVTSVHGPEHIVDGSGLVVTGVLDAADTHNNQSNSNAATYDTGSPSPFHYIFNFGGGAYGWDQLLAWNSSIPNQNLRGIRSAKIETTLSVRGAQSMADWNTGAIWTPVPLGGGIPATSEGAFTGVGVTEFDCNDGVCVGEANIAANPASDDFNFTSIAAEGVRITPLSNWGGEANTRFFGEIRFLGTAPVPEPSTLALGVIVLAGLALGNWRRRSRG